MTSSGPAGAWMRRPGVLSVALAVATAGLFARVVTCDFINFDDPLYVTANPHVQAGLTRESVAWAFTNNHASNWSPLTWLSLELDATLFGLSPAGYHAVNLVLHVANTVLLFRALYYMTGATIPSACVALLFAIHPLHVESVAWVSERKDVLSTLFWMLALIAYAWYAEQPAAGRYVVVLVLLALGLAAKAMLVTLPFVFLLLDYWPLKRIAAVDPGDTSSAEPAARFRRSSYARLIAEKLPMLALTAVFSWIAAAAQTRGGAVATTQLVPWQLRLMNAADAYLAYLWKAVWPLNLAIMYPHPMQKLAIPVALAEAALLVGVSLWVCRQWRRPYLAVGWFWYVGTLVPVIGLVQLGAQAMADRYTYIPLVGIFVACVWGIADFVQRGKVSQKLAGGLGAVAFISFGVCTWNQLGYWRDDITLWRHSVAVTGTNWKAYECLGLALLRRGQAREAIPLLAEVVSATPDYDAGHFCLGTALMMVGDRAAAKEELEHVLRLNPHYTEAHENLALVLEAEGRWQEAERHLREVLAADPRRWKLQLMLGEMLKRQGRLDDADRAVRQALAINPQALEEIAPQRPLSPADGRGDGQ
jgi:tetratricopeptide (TPR) repeat protein